MFDAMQDSSTRWAVEAVRRYIMQGRPDRAYHLTVALASHCRHCQAALDNRASYRQ